MTRPVRETDPALRGLEQLSPEAFTRAVRWAIRATLFAYSIFVVVGMFNHPERFGSRVGEFTVLLLAGGAALLHARGRPRPAGLMLLFAVFLELHASLLWDGIAYAPGLIGTPLIVLVAGLFLGLRVAWLMTVGTWVFVTGAAVTHSHLTGGGGALTSQDLGTIVFVVVITFVTALLTSLSLRTFAGLVDRAEASASQFSVLVERVPDALLGLDPEGRIETVNQAAEALFQRDVIDLLGVKLGELTLPGGGVFANQVHVPSLMAVERGEVLLKLPFPGGIRDLEVRVRPLPRPGGETGRIVILRDVTEIREARERMAQLGRIVDDALHEIHVFSPEDLTVHFLNRGARANLGYGVGELPRSITQVNPTLTLESVRRLVDTPGGEARAVRGIQRRVDGSVYPIEALYQRGSFEGRSAVIAFVVDVTDRVRAEEEQLRLQQQLEHSQRLEAVGHLAGGVAHDFNNLLTVMGAAAETLRDEVPPEAHDLVDELIQAQERGAVLTRQLLAFARKEVVQPMVMSVAAAIDEMNTLARRVLSERVEFEVAIEGDPHILADRGQFEQIIVNLLANARDALPEGGRVRLTGRVESGGGEVPGQWRSLVLEVVDDGVGMDADTTRRVFEPFFTTKPKGKGTGLGLATVHGIVIQNGGDIEVDSELGVGTTVRLRWPVVDPESGEADGDDDEATGPHIPARVLFAEDNDTARVLVGRLLERAGHTVTLAASGEEALELYEKHDGGFDILLSDVVMPGISGIELADELSARGFTAPVLFVSGYLDGHLPRVEGLGATRDLLLKPFRTEELARRIQSLLTTTDG